ncbi:HEAT repeat domain-containing protein, partial [candidate division KSB1 bacterium]|nr:HEAT repeat domain-containing protein [candidate division KSB1 bacterium]
RRAVEPLIQSLKDASWQVHLAAAESLGSLEDARALKPLSQALKDENKHVRKEAAEALGDLSQKD